MRAKPRFRKLNGWFRTHQDLKLAIEDNLVSLYVGQVVHVKEYGSAKAELNSIENVFDEDLNIKLNAAYHFRILSSWSMFTCWIKH